MNGPEAAPDFAELAPTPSQPPDRLEEDEIELLDYLEVLVRRRWLIFWGVVICAAVSFGLAATRSPLYRAEANVLPSQERDLELDGRSAELVRRSGKYLVALQGLSIRRSVLNRVLPHTFDGRPDSVRFGDFLGGGNTKQSLDGLAACSEFTQDASGVITISVTLEDPVMAAAAANAYVEELVVFYTEKQQEQTTEDLAFIETRMKTVGAELRAAESSLVAFHRANVAIQDPALSIQLSHIQRQVNLKSSIYSTLANQYELARIQARKEAPHFEVLGLAPPTGIPAVPDRKRTVLLSAVVGLLVAVFLAFVLEYFERNRRSGRMEPILDELRKDLERVRSAWGVRAGRRRKKEATPLEALARRRLSRTDDQGRND